MRKSVRIGIATLILLMVPVAVIRAGDTDLYIKQLKAGDPDIRAKAAYELGCG